MLLSNSVKIKTTFPSTLRRARKAKTKRKNYYAKQKQHVFISFQKFTGFCATSLIKRLTRTVKEIFFNFFKQVEIYFVNPVSQLTLISLQNLSETRILLYFCVS